MFRMMALVRLKDESDVDAVMAAANVMIEQEPLILSGDIGRGLRLFEEYGVPHAHYSVLLNFADEASWRTYIGNEPHASFDAATHDKIDSMIATQYITTDDS
ncbi:MAG: hypothetical protein JWN46_121 [Acidimicrobiales bacterium]|nr:hypothetical protein [Acidimicrobiales bacterium]